MAKTWWCEHAVVSTGTPDTDSPATAAPAVVRSGVRIEVDEGRIAHLETDTSPQAGDQRLAGLVIPGLANCHSHAFHRALRGRTQAGRGSFWTWREQMYAVAERLDPDSYYELARATYAEMVLAGVTAVGEFHYLHHQPSGTPYADSNEMGRALIRAAGDAGLRITLLDTCYLRGGIGTELEGMQRRFGDGDVEQWVKRIDEFGPVPEHALLGAAAHSVRAVPADQLPTIARWAEQRQAPLHAHVSEQPAENEQSRAAYGATPTEVLDDAGMLSSRFSAVHATHLTDADVQRLGGTGSVACFCPTTERDLADGVGPARALVDAGSPLSLGSDSHAVIDLLEEARAVELDARLVTGNRGHFSAAELLDAATAAGHRSIGWSDAGSFAVGQRADLVAIDAHSVRTAGFDPDFGIDTAIFAASAPDVTDVIIDGRPVVRDRVHQHIPDVGAALHQAIGALR